MPFILITVLIDMISIGLIIPVLPPLVGSFTADPTDQAFWYGAVTFAFGIANFFGSPILGALSDRYGRRPVLLIGFSGLALSFFVTALATALWMLIAVRLFSGAMQANAAVANAYVADITPPEERARRFGLLGAMFGLGFILGPVLGGLLGAIDLRLPFFAGRRAGAGELALRLLRAARVAAARAARAFDWRTRQPGRARCKGLAELKGIGPLVVVLALVGLAQFVLYTTLGALHDVQVRLGAAENGWSLFAVGVMSALVQGVLLKHLLRRFSRAAARGDGPGRRRRCATSPGAWRPRAG